MSKVSIIIATHSRPHLLARAVKSAFESGTDVEVIVVDDASTDETAEVCGNLHGIKYIRTERNQRVAGARNLGILASTGDYITFLDDDDIRLPGSLNKQVELLESNAEAGLVYGKCLIGDDNCLPTNASPVPQKCFQGDVFWDLLSENFIPCGSAVFRKDCIYKVGLLEKNLHRFDDWDMWVRIAELYLVVALEEPVYIWRAATLESQQGSSVMADILPLAFEVYKKRWFELPRAKQAPAVQRLEALQKVQRWMGDMIIWQGIQGIRSRYLRQAQKSFLAAMRINPQLFFHPVTLFNIVKYSCKKTELEYKN